MGNGQGFSKDTLKVKSKMASNRIKMKLKKKENALILAKKNIAILLRDNKTQSARIKVEGIIREENTMKVMEWLDMMCDLVHQRVNLINNERKPPEDLMETMCSILYCSKRIEIPELMEISKQFGEKYGEKWIKKNKENRSGYVTRKLKAALTSKPPTMEAVQKKLVEIATENDVEWDPEAEEETMRIVKHKEEEKVEVNDKVVRREVEIFTCPNTFDMTVEQKKDMMRKRGCNAAEAAAALHIVAEKLRDREIRRMQPCAPPSAPLPFYEAGPSSRPVIGASTNNEQLHGPSCPEGHGESSVVAPPTIPPGAPGDALANDMPQPSDQNNVGEPENERDSLDSLEARFAALRK